MGKSSAPPPNYMGLIMAQQAGAYAGQDQQMMVNSYDWAHQAYDKAAPQIDQAVGGMLSNGRQQGQAAQDLQNQYDTQYAPMNADYNKKVMNWDTPASEQQVAGEAQSGVASQFEQARQASQQQLEGYGIDPSSTRFAALDIGTRTAQAAAAAGAGTGAIQTRQMQGMGLEQGAIQEGNMVAGLAANDWAGSNSANGAAVSARNGQLTSGATAMNGASAFGGAANGMMSDSMSAINNYNDTQSRNYAASQQASSGLGSMLGLGAGLLSKFAEGGDVGQDPSQTPGGAIPTQASPSGGHATDDVPARLTAGEFVMPKDAVEWLGMKAMYSMVDKARQERQDNKQNSPVKPRVGPASPAPPAFVSRPQTAIPVQQAA
jgi:hypothetical protein